MWWPRQWGGGGGGRREQGQESENEHLDSSGSRFY